MEDQQKLKLEKYNYIKDEAEKGHKRDVNLIKKIDSNNKNWKKEYGAKKKQLKTKKKQHLRDAAFKK